MKILFFTWFIKGRSGPLIAETMEKLGNEVIKVACDIQNKTELSKHDFHLFDFGYTEFELKEIANRRLRINCKMILNKIKQKFDCIYIYQITPSFNTKNIKIPVFYQHHECLLPSIPDGRIDMIFGGYHGYREQLDKIYRDRIYKIPQYRTHFLIEDKFEPELNTKNRSIFFGFKGAFTANNPDNDMAMNCIYEMRRDILEYARNELDCYIEGFLINPYQFDQLVYFLKKCNLALNVSGAIGNWGFNNERMLLAIMCGCVLVHNWYPTCEDDGLINYETALVFKTKEELKERIEWAKSNPDKLEIIRKNGYESIKEKYNPDKIVGNILDKMQRYLEIPQYKRSRKYIKSMEKRLSEYNKAVKIWIDEYKKDPNNCGKRPTWVDFGVE